MSHSLPAPPRSSSFSIEDLSYTFFRHKWKILAATAAGLAAAAAFYFLKPPAYQSEALLYIRYVMENSAPGVPGNDAKPVSPDQRGETIIATEADILGSLDIAYQAVDIVGAERVLGATKGAKDRDTAAIFIHNNLVIQPLPKSSVIRIIYQCRDPAAAQPVLAAVIEAYLKKHVEIHRGIEVAGDFLSQETDQLRSRLAETEDQLRKAKEKVGIMSLDDAKKTYSDEVSRIQQDIFSAQAELAERAATLQSIEKSMPLAATASAAVPAPIPDAQLTEYGDVRARLDWLGRTQERLLAQFTDQNQRVRDVRAEIASAQARKKALEARFPGLARLAAPAPRGAPATNALDYDSQAALLAGLQSKIKVLSEELAQVKAEERQVEQSEAAITELQRQKDLEEADYRYYSTHLEAARIDEALGAGRAYNIAEIQSPTPPHIDWAKAAETLGGIAAAGIALGALWAFLVETYFDRTIRRPGDVERELHIPLFLSVPHFGRNGHDRHIFHETLRDRLIGFFESINLTHKPKLVAVTGIGRHAGVTTTAAGLAQSLSETGDGNVLLVDMTAGQGSAQQFFKGEPVCKLDEVLDTRQPAQVQDNLYVVGEEPKSDKLGRALPSRFNRLVPKLKASDFDYIIFDMPAINQISITPRLAGFMDMVLLVIESEHTDRDLVKQAVGLLAQSRTHVGAVLNKSRNYLPSAAHHEFLGSA